jgi:hypothetical protein
VIATIVLPLPQRAGLAVKRATNWLSADEAIGRNDPQNRIERMSKPARAPPMSGPAMGIAA